MRELTDKEKENAAYHLKKGKQYGKYAIIGIIFMIVYYLITK